MSLPTIETLRSITDEQLIQEHDKIAIHVEPGISYYLDELSRRKFERQNEAMLRYTKWITMMTFLVTVATFVNLWIAFK
ncbi:MAG: hypothetical protein M0Q21_12215 [Ignavibacteriaceae bacterium]|nr:hypothetical protein [Ignavibacteriaceae bacterium]